MHVAMASCLHLDVPLVDHLQPMTFVANFVEAFVKPPERGL
jgi:hypothetical protein